MSPETRSHLFDPTRAFDHPVTIAVTAGLTVILVVTPAVARLLADAGRINAKLRAEILLRYRSWVVLVPVILVPILLGAAWTMLGVTLLSLLCYREFARATGLFRETTVSLVVVLGILGVSFATLDHWYRLFVALFPLTTGVIAIAAILRDEPKGYVQRVGLGVLGFALFGSCLGHLAYLANDRDYRPTIILVILVTELNDVFAFVVGKSVGRRKLAPNTSPNKTVGGSLGAVVLTTVVVVGLGGFVFAGTPLADPRHLLTLGLIVSVLGQFGDLMLSSVKRDLGIKDLAATIPGHGGFLDRFDSLILVSPAVFHYVNYFSGVGSGRSTQVFSGW